MIIEYKQAAIDDAGLLVEIYNASFFSDYQRFGTCPGYGKTIEMMEKSIQLYPKHIIMCDNKPVGCVSCRQSRPQEYEIGCLCVIPEYQGKGIGTQAVRFVQDHYDDWKRLTPGRLMSTQDRPSQLGELPTPTRSTNRKVRTGQRQTERISISR